MSQKSKRHPVTWMVWTLSASVVALLMRNPWYLLLLTVVSVLVYWHESRERPGSWYLKMYLSLLIFPTILNFLFSRSGDTVLLKLPIRWIGGPYTLEAFVFGASAGIQIACLLTIMIVFSKLVNSQDLLRRIPSALYPVGVTASIGLTFVPHARQAFDAIREAQQLRGYQPKGWRDLPKVVTPLVILSLERAIAVAENLVTRGWGSQRMMGWQRVAIVIGLVGLAGGLSSLILFPTKGIVVFSLVLISVVSIWLGFRSTGKHERFRPDLWHLKDSLIIAFTLSPLVIILFLAISAPVNLTYYPYPIVSFPNFQWPIALAILLLSSPLWFGSND